MHTSLTILGRSGRRRAAGYALAIVAALLVGSAVPAAATPHSQAAASPARGPAATKTVITSVTPFFADGRVRLPQDWNSDGVTVERTTCSQAMVASAAGVFSCGGVSNYLAACWPNPIGATGAGWYDAFCMRTAGDKHFIPAFVQGPLPKSQRHTAADPWQITLDGGVVCNLSGGFPAANPPAGLRYMYSCTGGYVLLARNGRATFTAKTGMVLAQKKMSRTAKVVSLHAAKVIYAGAAPTKVEKARIGAGCPAAAVLVAALPKGSTIEAGASDGIHCTAKWAYTAYTDGEITYAGLFALVNGRWQLQDRSKACNRPGPVPAAIYVACQVS